MAYSAVWALLALVAYTAPVSAIPIHFNLPLNLTFCKASPIHPFLPTDGPQLYFLKFGRAMDPNSKLGFAVTQLVGKVNVTVTPTVGASKSADAHGIVTFSAAEAIGQDFILTINHPTDDTKTRCVFSLLACLSNDLVTQNIVTEVVDGQPVRLPLLSSSSTDEQSMLLQVGLAGTTSDIWVQLASMKMGSAYVYPVGANYSDTKQAIASRLPMDVDFIQLPYAKLQQQVYIVRISQVAQYDYSAMISWRSTPTQRVFLAHEVAFTGELTSGTTNYFAFYVHHIQHDVHVHLDARIMTPNAPVQLYVKACPDPTQCLAGQTPGPGNFDHTESLASNEYGLGFTSHPGVYLYTVAIAFNSSTTVTGPVGYDLMVQQSAETQRIDLGEEIHGQLAGAYDGQQYSNDYYVWYLPTKQRDVIIELKSINNVPLKLFYSTLLKHPNQISSDIMKSGTDIRIRLNSTAYARHGDRFISVSCDPSDTTLKANCTNAPYSLLVTDLEVQPVIEWGDHQFDTIASGYNVSYRLQLDRPQNVSFVVDVQDGSAIMYADWTTRPTSDMKNARWHSENTHEEYQDIHILSKEMTGISFPAELRVTIVITKYSGENQRQEVATRFHAVKEGGREILELGEGVPGTLARKEYNFYSVKLPKRSDMIVTLTGTSQHSFPTLMITNSKTIMPTSAVCDPALGNPVKLKDGSLCYILESSITSTRVWKDAGWGTYIIGITMTDVDLAGTNELAFQYMLEVATPAYYELQTGVPFHGKLHNGTDHNHIVLAINSLYLFGGSHSKTYLWLHLPSYGQYGKQLTVCWSAKPLGVASCQTGGFHHVSKTTDEPTNGFLLDPITTYNEIGYFFRIEWDNIPTDIKKPELQYSVVLQIEDPSCAPCQPVNIDTNDEIFTGIAVEKNYVRYNWLGLGKSPEQDIMVVVTPSVTSGDPRPLRIEVITRSENQRVLGPYFTSLFPNVTAFQPWSKVFTAKELSGFYSLGVVVRAEVQIATHANEDFLFSVQFVTEKPSPPVEIFLNRPTSILDLPLLDEENTYLLDLTKVQLPAQDSWGLMIAATELVGDMRITAQVQGSQVSDFSSYYDVIRLAPDAVRNQKVLIKVEHYDTLGDVKYQLVSYITNSSQSMLNLSGASEGQPTNMGVSQYEEAYVLVGTANPHTGGVTSNNDIILSFTTSYALVLYVFPYNGAGPYDNKQALMNSTSASDGFMFLNHTNLPTLNFKYFVVKVVSTRRFTSRFTLTWNEINSPLLLAHGWYYHGVITPGHSMKGQFYVAHTENGKVTATVTAGFEESDDIHGLNLYIDSCKGSTTPVDRCPSQGNAGVEATIDTTTYNNKQQYSTGVASNWMSVYYSSQFAANGTIGYNSKNIPYELLVEQNSDTKQLQFGHPESGTIHHVFTKSPFQGIFYKFDVYNKLSDITITVRSESGVPMIVTYDEYYSTPTPGEYPDRIAIDEEAVIVLRSTSELSTGAHHIGVFCNASLSCVGSKFTIEVMSTAVEGKLWWGGTDGAWVKPNSIINYKIDLDQPQNITIMAKTEHAYCDLYVADARVPASAMAGAVWKDTSASYLKEVVISATAIKSGMKQLRLQLVCHDIIKGNSYYRKSWVHYTLHPFLTETLEYQPLRLGEAMDGAVQPGSHYDYFTFDVVADQPVTLVGEIYAVAPDEDWTPMFAITNITDRRLTKETDCGYSSDTCRKTHSWEPARRIVWYNRPSGTYHVAVWVLPKASSTHNTTRPLRNYRLEISPSNHFELSLDSTVEGQLQLDSDVDSSMTFDLSSWELFGTDNSTRTVLWVRTDTRLQYCTGLTLSSVKHCPYYLQKSIDPPMGAVKVPNPWTDPDYKSSDYSYDDEHYFVKIMKPKSSTFSRTPRTVDFTVTLQKEETDCKWCSNTIGMHDGDIVPAGLIGEKHYAMYKFQESGDATQGVHVLITPLSHTGGLTAKLYAGSYRIDGYNDSDTTTTEGAPVDIYVTKEELIKNNNNLRLYVAARSPIPSRKLWTYTVQFKTGPPSPPAITQALCVPSAQLTMTANVTHRYTFFPKNMATTDNFVVVLTTIVGDLDDVDLSVVAGIKSGKRTTRTGLLTFPSSLANNQNITATIMLEDRFEAVQFTIMGCVVSKAKIGSSSPTHIIDLTGIEGQPQRLPLRSSRETVWLKIGATTFANDAEKNIDVGFNYLPRNLIQVFPVGTTSYTPQDAIMTYQGSKRTQEYLNIDYNKYKAKVASWGLFYVAITGGGNSANVLMTWSRTGNHAVLLTHGEEYNGDLKPGARAVFRVHAEHLTVGAVQLKYRVRVAQATADMYFCSSCTDFTVCPGTTQNIGGVTSIPNDGDWVRIQKSATNPVNWASIRNTGTNETSYIIEVVQDTDVQDLSLGTEVTYPMGVTYQGNRYQGLYFRFLVPNTGADLEITVKSKNSLPLQAYFNTFKEDMDPEEHRFSGGDSPSPYQTMQISRKRLARIGYNYLSVFCSNSTQCMMDEVEILVTQSTEEPLIQWGESESAWAPPYSTFSYRLNLDNPTQVAFYMQSRGGPANMYVDWSSKPVTEMNVTAQWKDANPTSYAKTVSISADDMKAKGWCTQPPCQLRVTIVMGDATSIGPGSKLYKDQIYFRIHTAKYGVAQPIEIGQTIESAVGGKDYDLYVLTITSPTNIVVITYPEEDGSNPHPYMTNGKHPPSRINCPGLRRKQPDGSYCLPGHYGSGDEYLVWKNASAGTYRIAVYNGGLKNQNGTAKYHYSIEVGSSNFFSLSPGRMVAEVLQALSTSPQYSDHAVFALTGYNLWQPQYAAHTIVWLNVIGQVRVCYGEVKSPLNCNNFPNRTIAAGITGIEIPKPLGWSKSHRIIPDVYVRVELIQGTPGAVIGGLGMQGFANFTIVIQHEYSYCSGNCPTSMSIAPNEQVTSGFIELSRESYYHFSWQKGQTQGLGIHVTPIPGVQQGLDLAVYYRSLGTKRAIHPWNNATEESDDGTPLFFFVARDKLPQNIHGIDIRVESRRPIPIMGVWKYTIRVEHADAPVECESNFPTAPSMAPPSSSGSHQWHIPTAYQPPLMPVAPSGGSGPMSPLPPQPTTYTPSSTSKVITGTPAWVVFICLLVGFLVGAPIAAAGVYWRFTKGKGAAVSS